MTEKESALYSQYIIDGIRYDATPAELLNECIKSPLHEIPSPSGFSDIIDESTDPPVTSFTYDNRSDLEYAGKCLTHSHEERAFRMLYPESFTKQRIAYALLNIVWNEGHYRLGDLSIWARWNWNTRPLGNMAAFYRSAEAAGSYLFDLGVKLEDYIYEENDEESRVRFYAWLPEKNEDEEEEDNSFRSSPFESFNPWISENRMCPDIMIPAPSSWIIYIPFDTCQFSLGGSLLAQTYGHNGGNAPRIQDPDYFIDCYEVVRELVEDGIVMSAVTVSDGGLATAASRLCGSNGLDMDISGLLSSYQDNDTTRMLFSEVPGVLVQISDNDYDYIDSQLILQDVAYYPIGHPSTEFSGIRLRNKKSSDVAGILASLLGQASEGED